jgi:glycerol-3-phosphate acyltransferase PlsX
LTPIALDAMGGDHAPAVPVAGAVQAARSLSLPVLLVGEEARVKSELSRHSALPSGIDIVHASDVIEMDESPGTALLRKRDSSIVVAMNLVREGRASAVVSAGNSGAVMGAASLRLGMLPGVERPAIATVLPRRTGQTILLDAGATVDCRPENLLDFALIGAIYAQCLFRAERPRVGLLSIGEEPSKGSAVTKKAYQLLSAAPINFIGNIEGKEIAQDDVDVVVCDGFVGNAVLKATEGYAELFWELLKEKLSVGWRNRIASSFLRPAFRDVWRQLDYACYGGALLVGVNGVCIIGHGRSSPTAVENAIRVAGELSEQGVVEQLAASLAQTRNSLEAGVSRRENTH